MKNKYRGSLLLFLLLFFMGLGFCLPAFAQESPLLFKKEKVIIFSSRTIYAANDLFSNFKDLMPGDVKKEELVLENKSEDFDYIKVYLRALLRDKEKNPPSGSVCASGETIRSMEDFLSKLSLRVYYKGRPIYDLSAKELERLEENIYLGTLKKGESIKLQVELEVPLELGNKYMERIAEVDWVFLVEAFDKDGSQETISNRDALIQTGQKNQSFYLFAGMGFFLLFIGVMILSRKKRREDG